MTHVEIGDATFQLRASTDGAVIESIIDLATGTELLLRTPWADDPDSRYQASNSAEQWHRRYPGGWHTLLPHAGDGRTLNAVEHPFHGEAAWNNWNLPQSSATEFTMTTKLRTVPLTVRRTVQVADQTVTLTQNISNYSSSHAHFTWVEHPAFASAYIATGAHAWLPPPRSPVHPHTEADRFDLLDLARPGLDFQEIGPITDGRYRLISPIRGFGIEMQWDPELFPMLWVWRSHHAPGSPWWGEVDTIALEPASRPYQADPHSLGPLHLDPHASLSSTITLRRISTLP